MAVVRFLPVDARLSGMRWKRYRSYDFAKEELGVPIVASEASLVASSMPFVFLNNKRDYVPYALCSLSSARNAFVSSEGRWLGSYVPARLRSYPFCLSGHPGDDTVLVREDAITAADEPESSPFLASHGGLSEPVRKVQRFLIECRSEMEKTAKLMRKVDGLGLFERLVLKDLDRRDSNSLFVINWKTVKKSRATTVELSKDILLQRVLHAHSVSLIQIGRLRACQSGAAQAPVQSAVPNSDLEGFLDAVSDALRAG